MRSETNENSDFPNHTPFGGLVFSFNFLQVSQKYGLQFLHKGKARTYQ